MSVGDHAPPLNPNQLPPRAAMGLPDRLVDRLGVDVLARHADLLRLDAGAIVGVLENPEVSPDRRFAAGTALAFLGDPRLQVDKPAMVTLPACDAEIGLEAHRVNEIAARWRSVGVVPEWIRKECPRHVVRLTTFAIGRFPVTNMEFRAFLQDMGAPWLPSSWSLGTYPVHLANHPVWTIPPQAADAYASWLAVRTGRAFRLPTEAEWEYAASQGTGREFPWGDNFGIDHANTVESGPLCTTPVGMYPLGRTPLGIDDLAGNVEEYTADDFRLYPGGDAPEDDLLAQHGGYRVARGGSFTRYGDLARCSRRHGWYHSPIYAMGFRLAETL